MRCRCRRRAPEPARPPRRRTARRSTGRSSPSGARMFRRRSPAPGWPGPRRSSPALSTAQTRNRRRRPADRRQSPASFRAPPAPSSQQEGKVRSACRCRHDDRVDIVGRQAASASAARAARAARSDVGLPFRREMAPLDARARADPFVRRFDRRFEFGVRNHTVGQIVPDAPNHGAYCHSALPVMAPSEAASCPARPADATRAASRS